jgi:hypothetical protein
MRVAEWRYLEKPFNPLLNRLGGGLLSGIMLLISDKGKGGTHDSLNQ